MVKFIGLYGKKEVGKNTFYSAFVDYVSKNYPGLKIEEASFAYYLKKIMYDAYGVPMNPPDKDQLVDNDRLEWEKLGPIVQQKYPGRTGRMTIRDAWQVFGSDVIREWDENFWVCIPFVKFMHDNMTDFVVFTDCRFENEVRRCKNYNGIVIHLLRPAKESNDTHKSENQNIPNELFDFTIKGVEGVGPLTRQIHEFLDANAERIFG